MSCAHGLGKLRPHGSALHKAARRHLVWLGLREWIC